MTALLRRLAPVRHLAPATMGTWYVPVRQLARVARQQSVLGTSGVRSARGFLGNVFFTEIG